jgi:ribonuclease P protein component
VGFVVGRAVGSAVVRNRVKRRLRHSSGPLVGVSGWELVLRANPAAAEADTATLRRDLGRIWEKARS